MLSDMEEQPVWVERKVTPGSKHTNLFTLFTLLNLALSLFLLIAQILFNVLALPGKEITDLIDSSAVFCGFLLAGIGAICWAARKQAINPVQRGVLIALTNVAVAFGIALVVTHSASIVTHQTNNNAFFCRGVYRTNATMIFEMEESKYSKIAMMMY